MAGSPTGARDFNHAALADRPAVLGWRYASLATVARELGMAGVEVGAVRASQPDLARVYAGYRAELDALGFADRDFGSALRLAT